MEEKTRQAFKVTMKKLDKLNAPVADEFKEDLERERLDQVSDQFIQFDTNVREFPKSLWFLSCEENTEIPLTMCFGAPSWQASDGKQDKKDVRFVSPFKARS